MEFQVYNRTRDPRRLATTISKNIIFHTNPKREKREKGFIEKICKNVEKNDSVIYLLKSKDVSIGLISLSASSVANYPSLQIDYIFISYPYRKKQLELEGGMEALKALPTFHELDGSTPSEFILDFAIQKVSELQKIIGMRYLVLVPDNLELAKMYRSIGFEYMTQNKKWMFTKIK